MKRDIKILLPLLLMFLCSVVFAQEAEDIEAVGNWFVQVKVNPLTDEKETNMLTLDEGSEQVIDAKSLVIRLKDKPELFIVWKEYLGDNTLIRYRFDDGEVQKSHWQQSANKTALFYPSSKKLKDFVKKLLNAKKLVVGITPYNEAEQTAVFNLEGLKEAITPYLSDFGWEDLFEE